MQSCLLLLLKSSTSVNAPIFQEYPLFPFQNVANSIHKNIKDIHVIKIKNTQELQTLKADSKEAVLIENNTKHQADDPNWFVYRKYRFTASICNKFGRNDPKTDRGSKTLSHNIIAGDKVKPNNIVKIKIKMEYSAL